jgi:DNA (cytosine-5)-methyltransferase 1
MRLRGEEVSNKCDKGKNMEQDKFSLFDFCKKRASKLEIYGEETLDEEGNIIPFVEQAAIVTHYLQLNGKNVVLPYSSKAENILNLWHNFLRGEKNFIANDKMTVAESDSFFQQYLFQDVYQAPFQASDNPKFKFIDLFAGIGGFRMAFQNLGGECVFSSE